MRKEDVAGGLLEIYNRVVNGVELFEVKPWEVKIGQQMVVRPLHEIRTISPTLFGPYMETDEYERIEGKVICVDERMMKLIDLHRKAIGTFYGVEVTLSMLKLALPEDCKPEPVYEDVYSIEQVKKYKEVMEEMKSKVDRKRLQKMLSVSASTYEHKNFVSTDAVEQYLDLWAYQKYEYYILFGRQLSIEVPIEQPMTRKEMSMSLVDLQNKYAKYGPWLNMFETEDYVTNTVGYISSSINRYVDYCKTGMKLSGFFSKLFKDPEFDLDLSKLLQDKLVKGIITISIDPYDYLTSSINKHDWKSCHRITDGEWGTGSLSYLLDNTTLIAYKHNGKEYNYDLFGFKFSGNSKTFRQCIYFDKASCNMIFGRTYPSSSADDVVCKTVKNLLFNQIEKHFEFQEEQEWLLRKDDYEGCYEDISGLHYSDVENGYNFTFARLLNSKRGVAYFGVGYEVPCLLCGEDVTTEGPNGLCCDCDIYED